MYSKKTLAGALFVLIIGLMSCARKENKEKDVFVAPPPIIVRGDENIELKAWDHEGQKSLNLGDAIDVRNSGAAAATVKSRCRRSQQDYLRTETLPPNQLITLFKIMPVEVLSADLAVEPASCSFEVILSNSYGSRHIFNLGEAVIGDEGEKDLGAALTRDGATIRERRPYFKIADMKNLKLRPTADFIKGTAELICADTHSRRVPFDSVITPSDFDFERMIVNPSHDPNSQSLRPNPLCRMSLVENNIIQGVTPLFELQFPEPPLEISVLQQPFRQQFEFNPELTRLFSGDHKTLTNEFLIKNNGPNERRFKVYKRDLFVHVGQPYVRPAPGRYAVGQRVPWLKPDPAAPDRTVIEDQPDNWTFIVQPGGSVHFSYYFHLLDSINCQEIPIKNPTSLVFDFPEPFQVVEITASGHEKGLLQAPLGPRMFINQNGREDELRRYEFKITDTCGRPTP